MKHIHTLFAITLLALIVVGLLANASTAETPEPATAIHTPLNSVIASPAQLDVCVAKALAYTQATYPIAEGKLVVALKRQVTDEDFANMAPLIASMTPKFGVLMNAVHIKGKVWYTNPHGARKVKQDVFYILTPYPACKVEVRTFGDIK